MTEADRARHGSSDIEHLAWMSPETKQQALEKLHAVVNKIGYPDNWRDYSSVEIERDDFVGNVERADRRSKSHRQLDKIGKPVDRGEWGMTPPTVNAYYDPQMNDINFPAGVLQPPLFDPKMDDAPNYGNTGVDHRPRADARLRRRGPPVRRQGQPARLVDASRTPRSSTKRAAVRRRSIRAVHRRRRHQDQLQADRGRRRGRPRRDASWPTWPGRTQTKDRSSSRATDSRRNSASSSAMAQWACENERPENLRVHAITDPHSPGKYRINGVVNMPEFQKAFGCKAGQPMVREKPCRVW